MTSESLYYIVSMLKIPFNSQVPNSFPNNYFKFYHSLKTSIIPSLNHSLPTSQRNQNHQGFPQADVSFLSIAFKCILVRALLDTPCPLVKGNWKVSQN